MHPCILFKPDFSSSNLVSQVAFALFEKSKRPQKCSTRDSSVSIVNVLESNVHRRIVSVSPVLAVIVKRKIKIIALLQFYPPINKFTFGTIVLVYPNNVNL